MQSGLSQLIASSETVNLTYSIAGSTPHSGRYGPENIIVDNSADHTSRWSSAYQGTAYQWILLRLDSLSVLQWIKFGKYTKSHPCNMKEFKVLVGASEAHMVEILQSGLRNDHIAETFPVRHVNSAGVYFPIRFVKIVPISAHQPNYHTSIWHVSFQGIKHPEAVERVRRAHEGYREAIVLRHLLKHLRQRRLLTPFDAILSRSFMRLEHPLVTQLHENVLLHGNWSQAEQILDKFSTAGLFDSYLQSCQPYSSFKQLHGTDADGDVPCPRGGHAMCIDPVNDNIYLHGGFNGEKCLDDFWMYDVKNDKWKVLSLGTDQEQNAPGPRSCHKMVFDTKTGSIYVLGRLADNDHPIPSQNVTTPSDSGTTGTTASPPLPPLQQQRHLRAIHPTPLVPPPTSLPPGATRAPDNFCSEFFRYHTRGADAGKWDFLSFDTASTGGPPLVYDLQMVMDSEAQMLYTFGGTVVDGDWDTPKYAGMYCYNVRRSKWSCLMPSISNSSHGIPLRYGHSVLLDPDSKTLYIFAGQRDGVYLSDMYAYDLQTCTATEIFSDSTMLGGPDPSFSQRAVIDPELKEIYVMSGLMRKGAERSKQASLQAEMTYWVYRYGSQPGKWSKVLLESPPDRTSELSNTSDLEEHSRASSPDARTAPRSRFAYQVVYNPRTKTIFIHGGNAGKVESAAVDQGPSTESNNGGDGSETLERASVSDSEKENQPETDHRPSVDMRLNDLWRVKLHRPGAERVIRRAKFLIRSQQYREMCEEQMAVKALSFLKNEVAAVVDHMDSKESDEFRSLMKHLLAPSAGAGLTSRTSSTSTIRVGPTASSSRPTPEEGAHKYPDALLRPPEGSDLLSRRARAFEMRRVDERDSGEEIGDDDEEDDGSDNEGGGAWTNVISPSHRGEEKDESEAGVTEDAGKAMSVNPDALLDVPDPTEFQSRSKTQGSGNKTEIPSGLRYQQRTEVFEALLEFVGEEDKQPSGSLLDLVGEGGGGGTLTSAGIATTEHRPRFIR